MAGKVKAICLSKKKGTAKIPVEKIEVIENYGFKNDAHAGSWHHQVSCYLMETRRKRLNKWVQLLKMVLLVKIYLFQELILMQLARNLS